MTMRVLVVDDEEDFLSSIVARIRLRGIEVEGVPGGTEALLHLCANPNAVDVVLLDIKMPGMDGIETLRQIRQRWPSVEVVVLTGHASQEFNRLGKELGAFEYLLKPIRLEVILECLERAARHRSNRAPEPS